MQLKKLLKYYPKYLSQKFKFKKLGGDITHNYMILDDYVASAGVASGHYFHQDLLVASFIKKIIQKNISILEVELMVLWLM